MTLRLPPWKAQKIIDKADLLGHSTTTMMSLLLDYGLDFFDEKPLQHYAIVDGKYIVIFDRALHRQVIVEMTKKDGLFCHVHLTSDCEHCKFSEKVPYVKDGLDKSDDPPPVKEKGRDKTTMA